MEITGKIKSIGQTSSYGSNGFTKREIVITTEEQYPQPISVEFIKDKCSLLDEFSVGQNVTVGINLRGREWVSPQGETKYFNSVQGWRIQKSEDAQLTQKQASVQAQTVPADDDLPF